MRSFLHALLVAAMTILAAAPAAADPAGDVMAMSESFAELHSFHADITMSKGSELSLDVVEPNKMHMTMNGKTQVIKIAGDMWTNMSGRWEHVPMPAGMMERPVDMARSAGMGTESADGYTVTDEGIILLDGASTHKYHMVSKTDGQVVEMWTANSLPVQVQMPGKGGITTIKYSRYNSVPDITPPA